MVFMTSSMFLYGKTLVGIWIHVILCGWAQRACICALFTIIVRNAIVPNSLQTVLLGGGCVCVRVCIKLQQFSVSVELSTFFLSSFSKNGRWASLTLFTLQMELLQLRTLHGSFLFFFSLSISIAALFIALYMIFVSIEHELRTIWNFDMQSI